MLKAKNCRFLPRQCIKAVSAPLSHIRFLAVGEIEQIISTKPKCAVIGGRKQIKDATVCLLRELSQIDVISVDDEDVAASTYKGAIRIYEYN